MQFRRRQLNPTARRPAALIRERVHAGFQVAETTTVWMPGIRCSRSRMPSSTRPGSETTAAHVLDTAGSGHRHG